MPIALHSASQVVVACAALLLLAGIFWPYVDIDGIRALLTSGRDALGSVAGLWQYLFLAAVVTAAFTVRGATGFGSAAVAVPLAALALPVQFVIAVVAGLQLLSTTEFSVRNWRAVAWREMLRITPFMLIGVALGLYLFYRLDSRSLATALGIVVIFYAIYAMATAGRDPGSVCRLPWPVSTLLNTVGAVVGALFGGASSPFYAIYFKTLHLSRDAFRATMTMVVLVQVVLRIGGYAGMGMFDAATLMATVMAVPFMFAAGRIGDLIAERVSAITFNRFVGVVLLLSGVALAMK